MKDIPSTRKLIVAKVKDPNTCTVKQMLLEKMMIFSNMTQINSI